MFRLSNKIRTVAVLTLLAGTCGVVLSIPGCGSPPGRVKWNHDDPWTGHTDGEYQPNGPTTTLPAGWTPDGEQTVEITVDGKTYRIRICVSRNASNPNCVYINLGGCASHEGWQMYCRSIANPQSNFGPPPGGTVPVKISGGRTLAIAKDVIIETEPSNCPDEFGSADYDLTTGVTTVSFTTACRDEAIPADLYNVTITGPDGISLPSDVFSMLHDGIMPVGSTVEIQGSDNVVAWDCLQFHRPRMSYTSTDGHRVDAGIGFPQIGPPVAFVAVDGEIQRLIAVTRPND